MDVAVDRPFTTSLVTPPGDWATGTIGARVEVPVTRAIVTYWHAATLDGSLYTVTLDAPLDVGSYNLVWMDNAGTPHFEYYIPLIALPASNLPTNVEYPVIDVGEVRPSVDEVARLMRTRTVGAGSEDTGTFTDDTDPTADDIESVIDDAVDMVIAEFPVPQVNPAYYGQIKRAIALQTVLLVDPSWWAEEAGSDAIAFYQKMYTTAIAGVNARIQRDLNQSNLIPGMEPGYARIVRERARHQGFLF